MRIAAGSVEVVPQGDVGRAFGKLLAERALVAGDLLPQRLAVRPEIVAQREAIRRATEECLRAEKTMELTECA